MKHFINTIRYEWDIEDIDVQDTSEVYMLIVEDKMYIPIDNLRYFELKCPYMIYNWKSEHYIKSMVFCNKTIHNETTFKNAITCKYIPVNDRREKDEMIFFVYSKNDFYNIVTIQDVLKKII